MSTKLSDGSIIPTQYSVSRITGRSSSYFNPTLRMGVVTAIIYPQDKNSYSKKVVEYTVAVEHSDNSTGISTQRDYLNCFVSNLFGGLADSFTYTLRPAASPDAKEYAKGSKVLLLCINGYQQFAVIVGGLINQSDTFYQNMSQDDNLGHNLRFVFNGLSAIIDKTGALIVQCSGATKIDGTSEDTVDKALAGTRCELMPNGNFLLTTADDKESILVDRVNEKIIIKSTNGVEIGNATDNMLLGSTYRKAQSTLHKTLKDELTACVPALESAKGGSVLQALNQLVDSFTKIAQALEIFESGKYLSKSKLD